MRDKFWEYMDAPSPAKLAELTSMEQAFAAKLEKESAWPDGHKKPGGGDKSKK